MKHLGEKIWRLREARGLSQEELAERLDVSRQTVSNWENDRATPDAYKLKRLCEVLGVSADALLETRESGSPPEAIAHESGLQSVKDDSPDEMGGLRSVKNSPDEKAQGKRRAGRIALCAVLGAAAALLLAVAIVLFSMPAEDRSQVITSAFTLTPAMGGIFLLALSVSLLAVLAIILFKKK